MKINTSQPIIGSDGDPVVQMMARRDPDTGRYVEKLEEVTVAWVIQQVCNATIDKLPFDPESLIRCGTLAARAFEDEPDFSDADRVYILQRAAHITAPMVYLFLTNLFESEDADA